MTETLRDLFSQTKMIASPVDWTLRTGGKLEMKLSLSITGLIEEGLFLRCTAIEHMPDAEVVFQLEYHGLRDRGGRGPLARLEWNPIRPHNNKGRGPKELRYIEQHGTHFHRFEDNWNMAEGALLKGNLPIGVPVSQPIQGFTECVDYVGIQFRINNIRVIKSPEWVVRLVP